MKSSEQLILKRTLLIALSCSLISWAITQDKMVALGFIIGAVSRVAGFLQIIRMTNKIETYERPQLMGSSNYFTRMVFYGIVIWISLSTGVNVLTLLLGFVCMNIVILITTGFENRKESE